MSIGSRRLGSELSGGKFMDVVRGKLKEEVAEEGLDADSWSAVVKAKGKNKTIFLEEKSTFIITVD